MHVSRTGTFLTILRLFNYAIFGIILDSGIESYNWTLYHITKYDIIILNKNKGGANMSIAQINGVDVTIYGYERYGSLMMALCYVPAVGRILPYPAEQVTVQYKEEN